MTPHRFQIFIHVPKTAGTAVARLLEEAYTGRIFYDYGTERNLQEARTPQPILLYNRDSIPRHYRMIYGHFHHPKYADMYHEAQFLSMVRDPMKRAVSHYLHLARYNDPIPHPIAEKVKSGQWDIVELHRRNRSLTRVYSMYFEGRAVRDFSFILVQENLYKSLLALSEKLDMPDLHEVLLRHGAIPSVNSKPDAPLGENVVPISDAHLAELADMLQGEREIYDSVRESFAC